MKIDKRWLQGGTWKYLFERLKSYYMTITFLMVAMNTFDTKGISYWWLLSFIPAAFVILWMDSKWFAPTEFGAQTLKNPEWIKLVDLVHKIDKQTE